MIRGLGSSADAARRRSVFAAALILTGALGVQNVACVHGRPEHLPARLADSVFWRLVGDLSEPGGSFISDNLVSNESTFQRVIPELKKAAKPGGAYLGVGPDQNFTYVAALEPKIAFIVDIRRQNMLLHLMYKALIELSSGRVEFVSRLFSRPPRPGLPATSSARDLLEVCAATAPDARLFEQNSRDVMDHLVNRHGFGLSKSDQSAVAAIHRAFFEAGPDLRYAYPHRWFPTFADLVVETDDRGESHSYLSNEELFQRLKRLEMNNLIVPVVGDFAGGKTIRAIGRYLRTYDAKVSVFYTSNVEFYLFENATWNDFATNVASLPLDGTSLFIRAHFAGARAASKTGVSGGRSTMQLETIAETIRARDEGRIRSYSDVIDRPGVSSAVR